MDFLWPSESAILTSHTIFEIVHFGKEDYAPISVKPEGGGGEGLGIGWGF